jgi:formamidopyrimidine-DNA glycosylase
VPELPEVETMARELAPLVIGAEIVEAWTDWPPAVRHPDVAGYLAALPGRRIEAVRRRAKWLVVDLDEGAFIIQVKMTGQLSVVPATTPLDPYVHATWTFRDGRQLRLRDVRKFARIGAYDDAALAETLALHGPEPLDPAFTLAVFRSLLRSRRARLKPLLVDQAFLAGVGNIYADESLWRARLHPLRHARTLRPAHERRLYLALRALLAEAIERRGSSIDDYTAPEGDGEMQEHLDVYQRTGQPCHRCGRPIRRFVLGTRGTHFCSWCQRLPAGQRDAAARRLLRAGR